MLPFLLTLTLLMPLRLPPGLIEQEAPKLEQVVPMAPPPAEDPHRLKRWMALLGSNAFDAGTTSYALRNGHRERNPALRPLATNPWALMGLKLGVGGLEGLMMDAMAKATNRPNLANLGAAAITGLNTAFGINNLRHGRR